MFGRRKRSLETGKIDESTTVAVEAEAGPIAVATETIDLAPDTAGAETTTPIRSADAGQDSGLASIEAEFTISDADLALLDLSSIAFEQQASRLSPTETVLTTHVGELNRFMSELNASWTERTQTPVDLQPYFMIPERCWEGEHQQVLVDVLGLAPAQPWNVLPLAGDAATAAAVGVAQHPGARALGNRNIATTLIDEAVVTMHKTFEQATFMADTVDTAALEAARNQASADIKAIARRMAGVLVGTEAVDHARATFFND